MKKSVVGIFILCVVALTSCMKGVDEVEKQNENERRIQEYLLTNGLNPTKDTIGMYAVISNINPVSRMLNIGDSVKVNYKIYKLDGTLAFESEAGKPLEFHHGFAPFYGFDLAISWMRIGEKATALIPYYLAFGSGGSSDGKVPGYEPVRLEVELLGAKSEAEQMEEYIAKNGYTVDLKTANNLNIVWLNKIEAGDSLSMGKQITVAYKGYLTSGKKFDEGALNHLTGSSGLIRGFDLGVRRMKEGEKAIIIFPSKLGYEHYGSGTAIPPFAPLAFEVEITKVN